MRRRRRLEAAALERVAQALRVATSGRPARGGGRHEPEARRGFQRRPAALEAVVGPRGARRRRRPPEALEHEAAERRGGAGAGRRRVVPERRRRVREQRGAVAGAVAARGHEDRAELQRRGRGERAGFAPDGGGDGALGAAGVGVGERRGRGVGRRGQVARRRAGGGEVNARGAARAASLSGVPQGRGARDGRLVERPRQQPRRGQRRAAPRDDGARRGGAQRAAVRRGEAAPLDAAGRRDARVEQARVGLDRGARVEERRPRLLPAAPVVEVVSRRRRRAARAGGAHVALLGGLFRMRAAQEERHESRSPHGQPFGAASLRGPGPDGGFRVLHSYYTARTISVP